METQQKTSVSKRVAQGKHLGRRYCKRHGLVYTPLKSPQPSMGPLRERKEHRTAKRMARSKHRAEIAAARQRVKMGNFLEVKQ